MSKIARFLVNIGRKGEHQTHPKGVPWRRLKNETDHL